MQLKELLSLEIIKFILVGVLNTLIGFIVFSILYFILKDEIFSLFLAYILGIVINFKTYSKYVFTSSDRQIFINFIMIYLGIFLLNSLLLSLIINILIINPYFAQIIAIVIVTPVLYLLQKKYVFVKNKEFVK